MSSVTTACLNEEGTTDVCIEVWIILHIGVVSYFTHSFIIDVGIRSRIPNLLEPSFISFTMFSSITGL